VHRNPSATRQDNLALGPARPPRPHESAAGRRGAHRFRGLIDAPASNDEGAAVATRAADQGGTPTKITLQSPRRRPAQGTEESPSFQAPHNGAVGPAGRVFPAPTGRVNSHKAEQEGTTRFLSFGKLTAPNSPGFPRLQSEVLPPAESQPPPAGPRQAPPPAPRTRPNGVAPRSQPPGLRPFGRAPRDPARPGCGAPTRARPPVRRAPLPPALKPTPRPATALPATAPAPPAPLAHPPAALRLPSIPPHPTQPDQPGHATRPSRKQPGQPVTLP